MNHFILLLLTPEEAAPSLLLLQLPGRRERRGIQLAFANSLWEISSLFTAPWW